MNRQAVEPSKPLRHVSIVELLKWIAVIAFFVYMTPFFMLTWPVWFYLLLARFGLSLRLTIAVLCILGFALGLLLPALHL